VSVFNGMDRISEGCPCPWDALPYFRTYRIGAYLAHSIGNESHPGHVKLLEVLKSVPIGSNVLLSFGEIDCRRHVVRQTEIQKKDIESIAQECACSYFRSVLKVKNIGYNPIVWAAVPTFNVDNLNFDEKDEHGYYGTYVERNKATSVFNATLKKLCTESSLPFVSLERYLMDDKHRTMDALYMDPCHLSSKCIPLIIGELEKIEQTLC